MKKVAIVDYGMGNLDSVARAVQHNGGEPIITCEPHDFKIADYIILPGVGSFHIGMKNIRAAGLEEVLREQVLTKGIPFLGICLGMQLLATKGWEGEETKGLGWIEGEVKRFVPDSSEVRIPHVGWNEVVFEYSSPVFQDIPSGKDFYFVHSYHFSCVHPQDAIAHTSYCGNFISVVSRDNMIGVQFHPEKSQKLGLKLIKNFLNL
ncbi:imidazole glycerol phosphate synthase subunit HisH [Anabaena catenula]|uniref:Imidazole glycerol phosphate synthase subunit HisH n=1 Tax=Anabaena catenula FACHB-362 TaxID=2692877 RepID=A0ABR8IYB4_9NOST|nr:imidazole glycerol phosphate synthase subunit HisH [Anabaena catenula]MBD2691074.1 imidazole glycerol phosphate synthase subunit HisH [Anabaena catenula FACHB-362]